MAPPKGAHKGCTNSSCGFTDALAGKDGMRSTVMTLNGCELVLGDDNELPYMTGKTVCGMVEVAPGSCAFVVI